MKTGEFYSAGKLLLTGEYLVLMGAKALAVPLQLGQLMNVSEGSQPGTIMWQTRMHGRNWFIAEFSLPELKILRTTDNDVAGGLQRILKGGAAMSPGDFSRERSYDIYSFLEFDIKWGLGSSSSLVSNIAWWLEVDPFKLFRKVYNGSGYDVFCARAGSPIFFQLVEDIPHVTTVNFFPVFNENLYFVYLGTKQDSEASISKFRTIEKVDPVVIDEISELTQLMVEAYGLNDFMAIMDRHEELMSSVLDNPPVGRSMFPDFPGSVKSLGAWGGDFILAASLEPDETVREYFRGKGLEVIFKYHELAP